MKPWICAKKQCPCRLLFARGKCQFIIMILYLLPLCTFMMIIASTDLSLTDKVLISWIDFDGSTAFSTLTLVSVRSEICWFCNIDFQVNNVIIPKADNIWFNSQSNRVSNYKIITYLTVHIPWPKLKQVFGERSFVVHFDINRCGL